MNILPKKSWHVRNKDNIERVRRDEEKAAAEQQEKERRIALAESEARSEVLRTLARQRQGSAAVEDRACVPASGKHINLFEQLESGEKVARKNKQHEEEARKEKEKQEKAIGLLTYLGQGSAELEDKKPWYVEKLKRKDTAKEEVECKKKRTEDPLLTMNKYLEVMDKYEARKSGKAIEKKKPVTAIDSFPKPKSSSKKSIEELRAERLKREKVERIRQQQIFRKSDKTTDDEVVCDERNLRYNTQFNPDLARFK